MCIEFIAVIFKWINKSVSLKFLHLISKKISISRYIHKQNSELLKFLRGWKVPETTMSGNQGTTWGTVQTWAGLPGPLVWTPVRSHLTTTALWVKSSVPTAWSSRFPFRATDTPAFLLCSYLFSCPQYFLPIHPGIAQAPLWDPLTPPILPLTEQMGLWLYLELLS